MRPGTVAILAVVLAALSAMFVLDRRAGTSTITHRALIEGHVDSIRIRSGDLAAELRAAGSSGPWLVIESHAGETRSVWPAGERPVGSLLRVLANTEAEFDRSDPVNTEDQGPVAVIESETGRIVYRLETDEVAGSRGIIAEDGGRGMIPAAAARALSVDALLRLREPAVFPGLDATATSVRIEHAGKAIELRRVGETWALREPVPAPVSPRRASDLIGLLAGLAFTSFESHAARQNAELRIEIRNGENGLRTVSFDPSGAARAACSGARPDAHVSGRVSLLTLDPVRELSADSLIDPRALRAPPASIESLRLQRASGDAALLSRDGRGWSERPELAAALLRLLTEQDASAVAIAETDEGLDTAIGLNRFGGLPAGEHSMAVVGGRLVIRTGRVDRVYEPGEPAADSVIEWLLAPDG